MARRDSPTYGRYGTLTNRVKRTTRGTARDSRSLCRTPSPSARQTALADRIKIVARRTDTTPSGSYVALRTSAEELPKGRMSGIADSFRSHFAVALMLPDDRGVGEP